MSNTSIYCEVVRQGIDWLDKNRPNWVEKINVDSLDLSNPKYCVLGHTDGNYVEAVSMLYPSRMFKDMWERSKFVDDWSEKHGFLVKQERPPAVNGKQLSLQEAYKALTEAWVEVIKERRELAKAGG